jgi:hypothetical protein
VRHVECAPPSAVPYLCRSGWNRFPCSAEYSTSILAETAIVEAEESEDTGHSMPRSSSRFCVLGCQKLRNLTRDSRVYRTGRIFYVTAMRRIHRGIFYAKTESARAE